MRTSGNDEAQVVVRKAAGASDIGEVGLDGDALRQWHRCGAGLLRIVIAAFLHHRSINALLPPVSVKALAAQPNFLCIVHQPISASFDLSMQKDPKLFALLSLLFPPSKLPIPNQSSSISRIKIITAFIFSRLMYAYLWSSLTD
jgi:hypothetical protein